MGTEILWKFANVAGAILACKTFEAFGMMLRATIVLWGKPNPESQDISVLAAVSFGTEDLADEEKQLFWQTSK